VFAAVPFPTSDRSPTSRRPRCGSCRPPAGGRASPPPLTVRRPPFVQVAAPLAWSTLVPTIRADGSSDWELAGASPFLRHWIYDRTGALATKSGMIDFKGWSRAALGRYTPWGDEDSPALVTVAETVLEPELSATIMQAGARPKVRTLAAGRTLVEQGEPGESLFLLLDGVLEVDVDGEELAEVGSGVILGERAVLEGGARTATLRAVTPVKVAVAPAHQVDRGGPWRPHSGGLLGRARTCRLDAVGRRGSTEFGSRPAIGPSRSAMA
jgi:hypothetical protein